MGSMPKIVTPPPAPTPPSLAGDLSYFKRPPLGAASSAGALGGTFFGSAQGNPAPVSLAAKKLTGQ